jgi:glycosyltransferase involved in cell wall biosynthesis
MKFSVIIPVFNAEKHLEKCFDYLSTQTFQNIEIIAINDGSTDSSLSILNDLARVETRLTVLSQPNLGPSAARNIGIENSSGDYISFIDSDDWIENNAFEQLERQITENKFPDIVMFNTYTNDAIKNKPFLKTGLYDKTKIREFIYPRLIESLNKKDGSAIRSSVCLRVFKRNLVYNKIRFKENLRNNEDLVFCFEASIVANTFLYLGDCYLYHNCMTGGSLSRSFIEDAFVKMKPLFSILNGIACKHDSYDFNNQINTRVFRTLTFCFENEFRNGNLKSFKQKYFYIKMLLNDREVMTHLFKFKPIREKSKLLYYYFYKYKLVLCTMILASYKSNQQYKKLLNV